MSTGEVGSRVGVGLEGCWRSINGGPGFMLRMAGAGGVAAAPTPRRAPLRLKAGGVFVVLPRGIRGAENAAAGTD